MTSPGSAGVSAPARKERRMLSVVTPEQAHGGSRLDLDQLVREGARRMLAAALEAEVDAYLGAHMAERDERGRRLVVRNGHARQRGSPPPRAPLRSGRRGWMTAGSVGRGSSDSRCDQELHTIRRCCSCSWLVVRVLARLLVLSATDEATKDLGV